MNDPQMIRAALSHVPSRDRETWVRMAMAVKSALGDEGFDIWDTWSRTGDSYRPTHARAVWRSVKGAGRITIGSLFNEAQRHGFRFDPNQAPTPEAPEDRRRRLQAAAAEERRVAELRAKAARTAGAIVRACAVERHPYLARKGFPDERGLVYEDGRLVIPMRSHEDYGRLMSVQFIDEGGGKKFLPHGQAKGAIYRYGRGAQTVICEGYATALSIHKAAAALYRQVTVVVAFSAGNLEHVAKHIGGVVIADHDASGRGEAAARATGLPWTMPDGIDMDANDLHQSAGTQAVAAMLRRVF